MTAAPLPRPPYEPEDRPSNSSDREEISTLINENSAAIIPPVMISSDTTSGVSPVLALKELLACWHREQNKIQDLLGSLSFALRSFNNLNQFLELIPLVASRVTDSDGAALVLFKPNGQIKLLREHCLDGHACPDIRAAIEAIAHKMSQNFPLTSGNSSLLAKFDYQIKSYFEPQVQLFAIPILLKNSERGRLYVFSNDPEYAWTPTKQKLMRLVADQTAVAIENDELTAELRKKERLDRELEIGSEIQRQLFPRHCPKIQGLELAARCKTANRVGGDYYDFIPSSHDQITPKQHGGNPGGVWSVVIGDVMGKGVPAGLIMTMTRGMLRAEVHNGHSPAKILQHLNRVMYTDLENSNRFVTLFYSEYDPQTRFLSYSNAAHNPPLLWQASTQTIQRLDTLGMLIGLDVDSQYQEDRIQLNPGDRVIYYTDGFTDAANPHGDRFDEENLIEAFRWACLHCPTPQATLDYLFDTVQKFIGASHYNSDDMTLIVMQVQEAN